MNSELAPSGEWLDELKQFWVENETNAQWDLLVCYHEIGRRIVEEGYEKQVDVIANYMNRHKSTVYRVIQFYKKYPDINTLPEGKAINWHKVVNKYIPDKPKVAPVRKTNFVSSTGESLPDLNSKEYLGISYLEVQKIFKRLITFDPESNHLLINLNKKESKWDMLILSDKSIPTRQVSQPSCPNIEEGHKGCIQYIEAVQEQDKGHKFVNYPKQVSVLHKILRAGFTFDDMDVAINKIKDNPFYQEKGWDFATVAQQLERK